MEHEAAAKSILVIEDSRTQAVYLQLMLEQNGYIVFLAPDGKSALEMMARQKPSLVITDVMMPELDGYQLCRLIRANEQTRDLPVILLTSLSDPLDVLRGVECGADNFLTKPCDEGRLLSRIDDLFANRRIRPAEEASSRIEVFLGGEKRVIDSDPVRLITFLFDSYETAIEKNRELTKARDDLRQLSTHDLLTGLYNRAFFDEELQRLQRGRLFPVSVLVADVDDLKPVNDHLGHEAGDRLLQQAARILSHAFRSGDVVARVGGDEFAVLLPGADAVAVEEAMERIERGIEELNRTSSEFRISISVGAATAHCADELAFALRLSDERMYREKFSRKEKTGPGRGRNPAPRLAKLSFPDTFPSPP